MDEVMNNSEAQLESKISIQKGSSYYSTTPGRILTDGVKIMILTDDGKIVMDRLIADIKHVKYQFGIIYFYFRFKVYTVNFAGPDKGALATNAISGVAGMTDLLEKSSEAAPESEKWANFLRQKNVKFVGGFRQLLNVFLVILFIMVSVLVIFAVGYLFI